MPIFSKQIFYCRACGAEMFVSVQALFEYQVCDSTCWKEFQWKRTLSIMGETYRPQKGESDGHERND